MSSPVFAKWVFRVAGIYGVLAIVPLYFLEGRIEADTGIPIRHPEFFYGFAGVTLAWQIAFLIISLDPVRYHLLMLAAVVEKFSFVIAGFVLFLQQRFPSSMAPFALIDFILGVLFAVSYVLLLPPRASR